MERKRNNSSWVCDRLEELIAEYEKDKEKAWYDYDDNGAFYTYERIIYDLKQILYRDR